MDVKLNLKENWFQASNDRGASIKLGSGLDDGISPMEAVLMAAGGCSGIDVVSMLKKMRQPLEELEISVTGQRREEHPRYYTSIQINYVFKGKLEYDKVKRAVELSLDKYCSVTNGLEPKAKITYLIKIADGSDTLSIQ